MSNVLRVYQSSESGDVAPIVSEVYIERADWLRAKIRADAVRLMPIRFALFD